jgi:hypothetical protein
LNVPTVESVPLIDAESEVVAKNTPVGNPVMFTFVALPPNE